MSRLDKQNEGLRSVKAVDGPVVPKCTRQYEAAIYTETEPVIAALDILEAHCLNLPIHVVFGKDDVLVYVSRSLVWQPIV